MLGNVKVSVPARGGAVFPSLTLPQKIRDRQLAAPADSETLQALVVNELKTKKHTATEGLLWLVRWVAPPLSSALLLSACPSNR